MDQLGISYFQGSYIQGGRQSSGTLSANDAIRQSCERIERIEHLLHHPEQLNTGVLCQACVYDVTRKVDRSLKESMEVNKAYHRQLQQNNASQLKPTEPPSQSRAIDQYLKSVDLPHLLAASADLERDILRLEAEERQLSEQYSQRLAEHKNTLIQLSVLTQQNTELDYELDRLEKRLPRLHMMLDAAGLEINHLQRVHQSSIHANHICTTYTTYTTHTLPIHLAPLFDSIQVYQHIYGILNGRRLAYTALPKHHLNWSEVNVSWCNLVTMLLCMRNSTDLSSSVQLHKVYSDVYRARYIDALCTGSSSIITSGNDSSDGNIQYEYKTSVQLRPLRDHALLLLQTTRTPVCNSTIPNTPLSIDTSHVTSSTRSIRHTPPTTTSGTTHTNNTTNAAYTAQSANTPFPTHTTPSMQSSPNRVFGKSVRIEHPRTTTHISSSGVVTTSSTPAGTTHGSASGNGSSRVSSGGTSSIGGTILRSNPQNTTTTNTNIMNQTTSNATSNTTEFVLHLEGGVHSSESSSSKQHTYTTATPPATTTTTSLSIEEVEYRTSVLTLACSVVCTLLEIHYNSSSGTSGTSGGNGSYGSSGDRKVERGALIPDPTSPIHPTTTCTPGPSPAERCTVVLDALFVGLMADLACVMLTLGDQLHYTVPYNRDSGSVNKLYSANATNNTTKNMANHTTTTTATNTTTTSPTNTTNTLASSVLASSTILGSTLYDSVAYFSNMAGITNTPVSPIRGSIYGGSSVVNGVQKQKLEVSTLQTNDTSASNDTNSSVYKYTLRVQRLQEYKQQCVSTDSVCDVYSALLVCSDSELSEVEFMQKLVVDMLHTLHKHVNITD